MRGRADLIRAISKMKVPGTLLGLCFSCGPRVVDAAAGPGIPPGLAGSERTGIRLSSSGHKISFTIRELMVEDLGGRMVAQRTVTNATRCRC
ncbi:hypothetical protein NDU88_007149 [Pleurodeles waltl]|uniref:Uncharacterized protein n=1 Tax=Pleurodeles waltl TaxID=8319 RepID=A0AAV7MJD0_PLEWA|nr:hypothetical protein NDU88_007149 [Pleurodeles waltl]